MIDNLLPVIHRLEKLNDFIQEHPEEIRVYTEIFGDWMDRAMWAMYADARRGHIEPAELAAGIQQIEVQLYPMASWRWN
jgi:hypothetical protein